MADFEMEIILDYLNGSKVITRVLISGRGRKKRELEKSNVRKTA